MYKIDDHPWPTTVFTSMEEIIGTLDELEKRGNWVFRGNSRDWGTLKPTIDCKWDETIPRAKKLDIERQSIDLLRRWNSDPETMESKVLHKGITREYYKYATCDLETLMLLRHYGVPTRLLDWSNCSYIAAYFSVAQISDFSGQDNEGYNGEIWAFDRKKFFEKCDEYWKNIPELQSTEDCLKKDHLAYHLSDGERSFEYILRTAFDEAAPHDWIMPVYNYVGFPRYVAQNGLFTITSNFGIDHAKIISERLEDCSLYQRLIINSKFKKELRELLKSKYCSRGDLFPDTAGAAETVKQTLNEVFPATSVRKSKLLVSSQ